MNSRDAFRRYRARLPWRRRVQFDLWCAWFAFVAWVKDRYYGAPWEAQER